MGHTTRDHNIIVYLTLFLIYYRSIPAKCNEIIAYCIVMRSCSDKFVCIKCTVMMTILLVSKDMKIRQTQR